jgi:hypothetical protein
MPSAIARLADHSLLIGDGATGELFRVAGGAVTRVSKGTLVSPTAILATTKYGALATDSTLACVFTFDGKTLAPFVGRCGSQGSDDGPAASARFQRPMDIAQDPRGVLYVADFGVGIRRIDPDLTVKTVVPEAGTDTVGLDFGVGFGRDASGESLFVGKLSGVSICNASTGKCDFAFPSAPQPAKRTGLEGDRAVGLPFHLAALSRWDAVYSDPRNHRLRRLHFTQVLPVAGGVADDPENEAGGLADGVGSAARFNTPLAIVRDTDGSLLVADAGNHAIRRVTGIEPIVETPANIVTRFPAAPGTKRIAILGASTIWWNTDRAGSLENVVEKAIATYARPTRRARVFPLVFPGTQIEAFESYAKEFDGVADAVVLAVDTPLVEHIVPFPRDQNEPDSWRGTMRDGLESIRTTLAAQKIPLAVVMIPFPLDLSPSESYALQLSTGGPGPRSTVLYGQLRDVVAASKIPYYDALPDIQAANSRADHKPLFGTFDEHLSPPGRALVGCGLGAFLLKLWFATTATPCTSNARFIDKN